MYHTRRVMHSFHTSWLTHDPLIWFILPGMREESSMAICGLICGRWRPPAAAYLNRRYPRLRAKSLMVVGNIKLVWFLPTTSTIKSLNLIVSLRSPQVAGSRCCLILRSIRLRVAVTHNLAPDGGRWSPFTVPAICGDLGSLHTKEF